MNNHQGTPEKTSSRFLEISFKDVHEDSSEKKKLCSWIVLKVLKEKKISCRKRRAWPGSDTEKVSSSKLGQDKRTQPQPVTHLMKE